MIFYFNNLRDEEYKEFIDKCDDYFKELDKLSSWYAKIEARDIFHSSRRDYAKEKLELVKKAFESNSDTVYRYNNK